MTPALSPLDGGPQSPGLVRTKRALTAAAKDQSVKFSGDGRAQADAAHNVSDGFTAFIGKERLEQRLPKENALAGQQAPTLRHHLRVAQPEGGIEIAEIPLLERGLQAGGCRSRHKSPRAWLAP